MNAPFAWWWPLLAALLTLVAVAASSDYALSVPAAAAAVLVAALAVADTALGFRRARKPPAPAEPTSVSDVRVLFRAGELGREDLVLLLDRLERRAWHPEMPAKTPPEITAILSLRPAEFHRYLTRRLTELEGAT